MTELHATWDPASWGGSAPDGRTVRGTLHWVSAAHAVPAEVRLYDRLFAVENPGTDEAKSFLDEMNPDSIVRVEGAVTEPYLASSAKPGTRVQFERVGYFCLDPDSTPGKPVWNRTVGVEGRLGEDRGARGGTSRARTRRRRRSPHPNPLPKGEGVQEPGRHRRRRSPSTISGKVDLRVGLVKAAELVDGADKLLKLMVDLGEGRLRQIFTGLRATIPIRRCWSAARWWWSPTSSRAR